MLKVAWVTKIIFNKYINAKEILNVLSIQLLSADTEPQRTYKIRAVMVKVKAIGNRHWSIMTHVNIVYVERVSSLLLSGASLSMSITLPFIAYICLKPCYFFLSIKAVYLKLLLYIYEKEVEPKLSEKVTLALWKHERPLTQKVFI